MPVNPVTFNNTIYSNFMSSELSSFTLHFWQTPDGLNVIDSIVKKRVGQWEHGLRETQRDIVSIMMDEEDILWITATGDG